MQKQCSYFQKGICKNGNECKFMHTLDKMNQPSNQKQCAYFQKRNL